MSTPLSSDHLDATMTYGELPSYPMFKKHFSQGVLWPTYRIDNHKSLDGSYDVGALYRLVVNLKLRWDNGDEEAGNDASAILGTLGIEWV